MGSHPSSKLVIQVGLDVQMDNMYQAARRNRLDLDEARAIMPLPEQKMAVQVRFARDGCHEPYLSLENNARFLGDYLHRAARLDNLREPVKDFQDMRLRARKERPKFVSAAGVPDIRSHERFATTRTPPERGSMRPPGMVVVQFSPRSA